MGLGAAGQACWRYLNPISIKQIPALLKAAAELPEALRDGVVTITGLEGNERIW